VLIALEGADVYRVSIFVELSTLVLWFRKEAGSVGRSAGSCYRREDGLIVKKRDDLISSTRYAIMMRRSARQPPSVEKPRPTWLR
jgi:hypothetical protein